MCSWSHPFSSDVVSSFSPLCRRARTLAPEIGATTEAVFSSPVVFLGFSVETRVLGMCLFRDPTQVDLQLSHPNLHDLCGKCFVRSTINRVLYANIKRCATLDDGRLILSIKGRNSEGNSGDIGDNYP